MPNINPTASQIGIGILTKDSSLFNQTKVESTLWISAVAVEAVLIFFLTALVMCLLMRPPGSCIKRTSPSSNEASSTIFLTRPDARIQFPGFSTNDEPAAWNPYESSEYTAYAPAPPHPRMHSNPASDPVHEHEFEGLYDSGSISPVNGRIGLAVDRMGLNINSSAPAPAILHRDSLITPPMHSMRTSRPSPSPGLNSILPNEDHNVRV